MPLNDEQKIRLKHLKDPQERKLVRTLWLLQAREDAALKALDAHFEPLLHACQTKAEADKLLWRVPSTVAKCFYIDYIEHGRDWSKPHQPRG